MIATGLWSVAHERLTLTLFRDLGIAEPILRAVDAEGYDTPTPIQEKAIPAVLKGHDVIGIAQTGTGKTAAFVLPLLHRLRGLGGRAPAKGARILILSPTRELTAQIGDAVRRYGRNLKIRSTVVVGGAKPGPQIRACAGGLDILIATPGRLLDHVSTGAIRLNDVAAVVLDEADQMLDLGFMPAVRRILTATPKSRQTVLFSATMPAQIRALADDFLADPVEVSVAPAATPIERIAQSVITVPAAAKRKVLAELLAEEAVTRAIVFTRTKRGADRVCKHLDAAGLATVAIHGDKSQGQRERALQDFKRGRAQIMVATDIAARGIDVDAVSHVVNYELPNVPESYVHRIGRTARAGTDGVAISLVDPAERPLLTDIERLIGRSLITGKPIEATAEASKPANRGNRRRRNGRNGGAAKGMQGKSMPGKGHGAQRRGHATPRDDRAEALDAGVARTTKGRRRRPPHHKNSSRQQQPVRA